MEEHMNYTDLITKEQRLEMIKVGMVAQLIKTNRLEKFAQLGGLPKNFVKTTLLLSVLGGIPLGVAWHFMDRKTNERRRSERELQEKLKFYRNVSTNLETDMADQKDPEKIIG